MGPYEFQRSFWLATMLRISENTRGRPSAFTDGETVLDTRIRTKKGVSPRTRDPVPINFPCDDSQGANVSGESHRTAVLMRVRIKRTA